MRGGLATKPNDKDINNGFLVLLSRILGIKMGGGFIEREIIQDFVLEAKDLRERGPNKEEG